MPEKCKLCGNPVKNYKSYKLVNLHYPIKYFCSKECKLKWIFQKTKAKVS